MGLRESNRAEKRRRIKDAASALFTNKGFDRATIDEIAARAGVGSGTIFLYTVGKRDLFFQLCIDELELIRSKGFASIKSTMPLLQQLLTPEVVLYRHLAKSIVLKKIFFEELAMLSGEHANRLWEIRHRTISKIEQLIFAAESSGAIRCGDDHRLVAKCIFFSSQSAVHWWVRSPRPRVSAGIADLRRIYTLHLRALNPTAAAFEKRA